MEKSKALEPTWTELLGSHNWEGLLEPLDVSLRRLILRCGNFCQATNDAFNNDKNSKYCGSSRYGTKNFFNKVMLESASNYQIATFLYATCKAGGDADDAFIERSLSPKAWDTESNWIGYIAVTTDEVSQSLGRREVYVVWRGTKRTIEWLNNLKALPVPIHPLLSSEGSLASDDENVPEVMEGWLSIYTSDNPDSPFTKLSARSQLWTKIKEIRKQYENENLSIIVTGHSLGGSLTVLSAFDLVENAVSGTPVTAIAFAGPKVGNQAFHDRVKQLSNLKILQIKNMIDLIPRYPIFMGYVNTGVELEIDTRKSPHLKRSLDLFDWHNLEASLHTVAGWNGDDKEFEPQVERSLALVNKSGGALKDEYLIPESWWAEKNKGMVRNDDGEWVLEEPSDEDKPQPEFLIL